MITKAQFNSLVAHFDGVYAHVPDDNELPVKTPIRDSLLANGMLYINEYGKYQCTELGNKAIDEYVESAGI